MQCHIFIPSNYFIILQLQRSQICIIRATWIYNDRYVTEASNSTKAIWQVINKQIVKSQDEDYKFELKVDNNIMLKPMEITEKLNKHFMNTVTELVQQNINKRSYNNVQYVINHCSKSIFLFPVTEEIKKKDYSRL